MRNSYSIKDRQIRLNSFEIQPPLVVDGIDGNATRGAFKLAQEMYGFRHINEIFDPSGITRIHLHWTASSWNIDRDVTRHYNDVFGPDGIHYAGGAKPEDQAMYSDKLKIGVSHTKDANTGSIGLAVAGMAGATSSGLKVASGPYPMNWKQIDAMLKKAMEYCIKFDIKISPWTVLTHAEIQPTLGIAQNGKWDIRCLPDDLTKLLTAREAGDILRERMKAMFT